MGRALLIVAAIALGVLVPGIARAVPVLPWIIGILLLVSFCSLPRGLPLPGRLHAGLIAAAWLIGGVACAALWPWGRDLALGALLAGAAPTATAAPVVVAALRGDAGFAAVAVLWSNAVACIAFPALLAVLQGPDAPGRPWELLLRVAPVVLVPFAASRWLAARRPSWAALLAAQMHRSFALWLLGLAVISSAAAGHLREAGPQALLAPAAIAASLCVLGFGIGRLLGGGGRGLEAGQALGQKNTALATWTALGCAAPPAALVPVCYILAHNLWNAAQLVARPGRPQGTGAAGPPS